MEMNREQWVSFGIGTIVGVVAGGVIALLFAPKSGKETRTVIGKKVGEVKQDIGEKVADVRHTMAEKISGEQFGSITKW